MEYTDNERNLLIHRQATSARQMEEWGMRAFQASFPRVTEKLRYEDRSERKLLMEVLPRLYDYRATKKGINQIRNVLFQHLEQDAESILYS